jgi:hypothetical protein
VEAIVLTIFALLAIMAVILVIVSAIGKCPLWIPVFLIALAMLLQAVPFR